VLIIVALLVIVVARIQLFPVCKMVELIESVVEACYLSSAIIVGCHIESVR
jgi:hypothetical protein